MNWNSLETSETVDAIAGESAGQAVLIFKHSTRCSTSRLMLDRLERQWRPDEMMSVKPYLLDLLSFREVSRHIADTFEVEHESPQVLVIRDGRVLHHTSHLAINYATIQALFKN